jgi:hypothetical protein
MDQTFSAFSLLLTLPDSNGKAAGSDLFEPKLDLKNKNLVRQQVVKFKQLKCCISGREIVLEPEAKMQVDKVSSILHVSETLSCKPTNETFRRLPSIECSPSTLMLIRNKCFNSVL